MSPEEARGWLGLKEGASQAEIKRAWKIAAKKIHPDTAKNEFEKEQLNIMMQNVNEAYEVLTGKRNGNRSSSSRSQKRDDNTSKNTNQKNYGDDHEYQRWREEQRRKSSAGKEEQERRKEEWKKYNTNYVVVPAEWKIKLDLFKNNKSFSIYKIK